MGKWIPTSENINALPEEIRKYIHDLETMCDPSGYVQSIAILKDTIRALTAKAADAAGVEAEK